MTSKYPDICVLDFEATCEEGVKHFGHEIIEFPSVLLRWNVEKENYVKISEFQEFVLPLKNPELTDFCKKLTGIKQEWVDAGSDFPDVINAHLQWLVQESIGEGREVMIMTCGWWDLCEMLPLDCQRWSLFPEPVYRTVFNVKMAFLEHTGLTKGYGMARMLDHLGIKLEGRHHSGIDDCRNIAKIIIKLIDQGYRPWNENYKGELEWKPNLLSKIPKDNYLFKHPDRKKPKSWKELIRLRLEQREKEMNNRNKAK